MKSINSINKINTSNSNKEVKILNLNEQLTTEEEYAFETLGNKIKENPEGVTFSMLEQIYGTMGSFGDTRIKLIKSNFKSIIDNILTLDLKVFLA